MTITKDIALALHHGDVLHHKTNKGSDGKPMRCRVMGACKTWKSRPNDFSLPVKHGLYTSFQINQGSGHLWEVGAS